MQGDTRCVSIRQQIEKAVETLYYVGAIEENEIDNHYLNVYSMTAVLFQKAADYSLHGSCSDSTTREQRKKARNYTRFIGCRVANRRWEKSQFIIYNSELSDMNKARRKKLGEIIDQLEYLREDLDAVASEEREAYDNLPESLQESDRGCDMEKAAGELDDICSEMEDLKDRIQSVYDEY